MNDVLVKCACCGGTGRAPLSAVMQRTLAVVPRREFIATQEIVKRLNDHSVKATAVNNRLALWLLPLGLVRSERRGKALFWKRIK